MRENRTSGSMRGCWGSRTVGLVRHRQTKGAETDRPGLPAGGQCSTLPYSVPIPPPITGILAVITMGSVELARNAQRCGCRRILPEIPLPLLASKSWIYHPTADHNQHLY